MTSLNTPAIRSRVPGYLPVLITIVVSAALYLNSLSNGFVYDDHYIIANNPWITDFRYLPDIFTSNAWAFRGDEVNYYRPFVYVIYSVGYRLSGASPWGFHLINVLFHVAASVMVLFVAAALFAKDSALKKGDTVWGRAPLLAAILFASHPVHTEAVAWVSGLQDLSFSFFFLLSLYLYMKSPRVQTLGYAFGVASFAGAVLCKETALMLLPVLFAYDFSFAEGSFLSRANLKRLAARYAPYAAVAMVYLSVRFAVIGGLAPEKAHAYLSVPLYVLNAVVLFAEYLWKLLWPATLNAAYVFHPKGSLFDWQAAVAVLTVAAFGALLVVLRKRNRTVFFSLLLILLPLLPALYIPALGTHVFAERYLYLPSVGFVLAVSILAAWVGSKNPSARWYAAAVLIVTTLLYSFGTIKRNPVWGDAFSLWTDTVRKSPDGHVPHNNLGLVYYGMGLKDEAVREYKRSLSINPGYPEAHNNLGSAYMDLGHDDEAFAEFELAASYNPGYAEARYNMGLVYYRTGRPGEALTSYEAALELRPLYPEALNNLGLVYMDQGRYEEAVAKLGEAIRIRPGFLEGHGNLGLALFGLGRYAEAEASQRAALGLDPNYVDAHSNLGTILAITGRMEEAAREYEKALELDPTLADTRYNLGVAYLELGRTSDGARELEAYLAERPGDMEAQGKLKRLRARGKRRDAE